MGNNQSELTNLKYNVEVTEKGQEETSIYRNNNYKENWLIKPKEDVKDLHEAYKYYFEKYSECAMLGERRIIDNKLQNHYTWYRYKEVKNLAENLGTNLINKNLAPEKNEWNNLNLRFIGIYAKNSIKWNIVDFACSMQGITTIPIYDFLGEEATIYAFKQTNMETLFLTSNHYKNIFKLVENGLGQLKNLIIFDKENFSEDLKSLKNENINLYFYDDLLKCEEKLPWAKITPESIYTFSYTSGTTGEPKGAMISHKNIISLFAACQSELSILKPNEEVYLSYLPLAHVLERAISNYLFFLGSKYGYFSGNVQKITEDLQILKPTVFVSVPRLFLKIYQTIKEKFEKLEGMKKKLLNIGINKKLKNLQVKNKCTHPIYDKLIFNKAKEVVGGKVKVMLSGSAPISPDILDFLKICFSVPVIEGYGQTEGTGAEFLTNLADLSSGHVGGIYPHFEFKLVDIPEMNYFSTDKDENGNQAPRGEIWVRGNGIIPGYYKNDEKNKETFTEDGWMKSGDIGVIESKNKRLKIIDRKKNIFKLSQGEYIAPEKLENALKTITFLNDIFIYGDSLNSYIIAILNIDKNNIKKICKKINIEYDESNLKEILEKKELIEFINSEFMIVHVKNKFNSLEKIRKFYIETKSFEELDLLTTSFKVKRNDAKIYYKEIIDNFYKD